MSSHITLDALKVLDAIERKKSFAAAAAALFRVPSAVSYTVNKLEEELGVALFNRSKRKVELTPVGKMLIDQGRLILKATDELTHMAQQSANGWEAELRICIDSILLFEPIYKLIYQFQQEHPCVNIRVTEEVLGGTWDSLIANSAALIIGATGETYNSDFSAHTLGKIDFVFAVSKEHPLVDESPQISDRVIKQYSSVVVADSSQYQPTRSEGLFDGQSRITVPTIQKKIEAHLLGVGVGFLPIHRIQEELESGELVALQLASYERRSSELRMAWRKNNQGKALSWFVEKVKTISDKLI